MSVVAPMLWAEHSRCDLEFEDWSEIFENQMEGQPTTDWNQHLCCPPAEPEEDEEEEEEGITSETRSHPIPYRLVWMEDGPGGLSPDSDSSSPPPGVYTRGTPGPEEAVGSGGPEGPGSLDALEVLEVEREVRDDTHWLYESPRQRWVWGEDRDPRQSALSWSRRVLDHPSPDMQAACRVLNHILDKKSRAVHISSTRWRYSREGRREAYSWETLCPQTHQDHCREDWESTDHRLEDWNRPQDSRPEGSRSQDYRSQDLTELQALARQQEASLRGESPRCCWSGWDALGDITNLDPPDHAPSGPSANHRAPPLRKLQHRVTDFKLLTLLQSKVAPGDRGPAPLLRTSLRSLQAARRSRSMEGADPGHAYPGHAHPDHTHPESLAPPLRTRTPSDRSPEQRGSGSWSGSQSSAASTRLLRSTRTSSPSGGPPPPPPPSTPPPGRRGAFSGPEQRSPAAWRGNRPSVRR